MSVGRHSGLGRELGPQRRHGRDHVIARRLEQLPRAVRSASCGVARLIAAQKSLQNRADCWRRARVVRSSGVSLQAMRHRPGW